MKISEESFDVGVIVGRFQVPDLHDAHLDLIRLVCERHEKVIMFLGLADQKGTKNNPLDFEARKQMVLERFPRILVMYAKDNKSDEVWSQRLDSQIKDLIGPGQTVVLYGSRDSFIDRYHGIFPSQALTQDRWVSGTELRKSISNKVKGSADFRAGVIWGAHNRYPATVPTVDIAIFRDEPGQDPPNRQLLLVRKPNEAKFRFPGGFSDPNDRNYEETARRESREETGVEISPPQYVGSRQIDDWRFRGEQDKIKTILFRAEYQFGRVEGADDVAEARWFDFESLHYDHIEPEHHPLLLMLATKLPQEHDADNPLVDII